MISSVIGGLIDDGWIMDWMDGYDWRADGRMDGKMEGWMEG